MSFSHLQRRAFLVASITMAGVLAMVLCYWQAVAKGALPSPVQPMVAPTPHPVAQPATVGARAPAAPPPPPPVVSSASPAQADTRAPQPVSASPVAPAPSAKIAEPSPAKPGSAMEPTSSAPSNPKAAERIDVRSETPPIDHALASARTPGDTKLAAHWLSNTNERPVVRVYYDPSDILRLVELRRGVIVAGGNDGKSQHRELYLDPGSGSAPLFAPYTKSVADRYSAYSLSVVPSGGLENLTAAFPVYFPGAEVSLSFVPDLALATEIFTQVAQASRSISGMDHPSNQAVYEGELSLQGTQPKFRLLDVHSGSKHITVSPSG